MAITALTEKSEASIVFFDSVGCDCDDGCSGEVVLDEDDDSFDEFVELGSE